MMLRMARGAVSAAFGLVGLGHTLAAIGRLVGLHLLAAIHALVIAHLPVLGMTGVRVSWLRLRSRSGRGDRRSQYYHNHVRSPEFRLRYRVQACRGGGVAISREIPE
jgi:hypothetical protein